MGHTVYSDMNKIRLFVDHTLGEAQSVPLNKDQAHYIFSVMRKSIGETILIFDGNNGEWKASIEEISKKSGVLLCIKQTKPQIMPPDLWLFFSPLKKVRTDFIVEKATELGVAKIIPVQTEHTNADRVNLSRLSAHAIEAAEQCGGTYIPKIEELQKINEVLENFPLDRRLLFCDEKLQASKVNLENLKKGKWAILVGPEGGFSEIERNYLKGLKFTFSISLGPRILRADTAAVTAISLWQNYLGDW
jgi:16S rRNA (uracil1498-N3)-methyltransferase